MAHRLWVPDIFSVLLKNLVIFDDGNGELIFTMDWNGDQSRWELSTAAQLTLESHPFKLVEYDAEVRTSEGLDLVKTAFKLIAKQVHSKPFRIMRYRKSLAVFGELQYRCRQCCLECSQNLDRFARF